MREIKFRLYDELKGMVDVDLLPLPQPNGKEKRPLMQYTGLKDKNGKEIYEGDIVKTIFKEKSPMGKEIIFEVKWIEKEARWVLYNYETWTHEIIGNIYENPELI